MSQLTVEQIAIGCILGDAYITERGRLQIDHSTRQTEYVLWKYSLFQEFELTGKEPTLRSRYDRRTLKTYESLTFTTKAKFQDLRTIFYPNGTKIVPQNIDSMLLSPLALAIWFMDDGGRGGNTAKGQIISVRGFNLEDRQLLQQCLETNFDLSTNLHQNGQLYIPISSFDRFYELVSPFVIPSMRYKLSITP